MEYNSFDSGNLGTTSFVFKFLFDRAEKKKMTGDPTPHNPVETPV